MKVYIIAEIGQNHQGELSIAKKMIKDCGSLVTVTDEWDGTTYHGLDAVKFTKRDIRSDMSPDLYDSHYHNKNSFACTYGEHRQKLEFSLEDYCVLSAEARMKSLDFVVTICDIKSFELLQDVKKDKLKIASRDFNNVPLRTLMMQSGLPLIASTGMCTTSDINNFVSDYERYCKKTSPDLTIMHCISTYPAHYEHLGLKNIVSLKKNLPKWVKIGYSDHSIGIMAPIAAVALGAEVIEKHFTFDRAARGTDHKGSLELDGLWRTVRDIRNLEQALLSMDDNTKMGLVRPAIEKLGRSLCLNKDMNVGDEIHEEDFGMTSPGFGFQWRDRTMFVHKRLKRDYFAYEILDEEDVDNG